MELTIFKRLTIGYLAIMVVVVFLGVYVTFKLSQLDRITHAVIAVESTGIRMAEGLVEGLFSERGFEKKYLVSKDDDFFKQFIKVQNQFRKDLTDLERVMDTTEKKGLLARVNRWHRAYGRAMQREYEFISTGRQYPYEALQQEKEKAVEKINRGLREVIRTARQDRDARLKASSEISSRVSRITAVTAAVIIVMGILISFFNTRSINRPIHLLQEKTKEISAGKFEQMRPISSPPEIKELVEAFNLMCERLQELDEMKADFISHVSHELRTPLTAVKEASSMLLEGGFRDSADKQDALLQIINEECERLIGSVNRILDLSSMEARMTHYFFRDCSLAEIIEEAVSKFTPMSLRNGIALEMHLDDELPTVRADADRVGQVLENLLGNALKFTSSGGKVVVRAEPNGRMPGFVEVCVADTGCGIAEKDIEKIFDKFHRIDTGKETAGGTGLGLAIAKHIVAAHKGDIWVESEPGQGSAFYFSLPCA